MGGTMTKLLRTLTCNSDCMIGRLAEAAEDGVITREEINHIIQMTVADLLKPQLPEVPPPDPGKAKVINL